jgi:hypothetical protein
MKKIFLYLLVFLTHIYSFAQKQNLVDTKRIIISDSIYFDGAWHKTWPQQAKLDGGVVTHVADLTFAVTGANYRIGKKEYRSQSGTVTLDVAHPSLPRLDVIALNTAGQIVKITGTAALSPSVPQINPATEIYLTTIFLPPGATVPSGVNAVTIYNENTEWLHTDAQFSAIDFDNILNPQNGVKAIAATGIGRIKASDGIMRNYADFSVLRFYLRLNAAMPTNSSISVGLSNGGVQLTQLTASHGYNPAIVGSYQNISIPISELNKNSNNFIAFYLSVQGTTTSYLIDNIQIQGGIGSGTGNNYVSSVFKKSFTDSVFYVVNNTPIYAFTDNGTGGGGSATWGSIAGTLSAQVDLSTALNLRLNKTDTSAMLANYQHWLQGYLKAADIVGKVNISDTAAMLTNYRHWLQGYLKAADIVGKVNISDTAAMLTNYRHWLQGYLKAADIAGKQNTVTLTTNGSGAATFNSGTGALNIPLSAGTGLPVGNNGQALRYFGGVPVWRDTIPIVSGLYDTIKVSAPLKVLYNTITGEQIIVVDTAGAGKDGILLASKYNEFNNKQNAVALTTTGSGAATFNPSTGALNIPVSGGGSAAWGAISGTLSNQVDLSTALNLRLNKADTADMLLNYQHWLQGYLKLADIAGKQNTVALTTIGSGAATFNPATGALNIPSVNPGAGMVYPTAGIPLSTGTAWAISNVPNIDATNATNISSGILPDARLGSTVVFLAATQNLINKSIDGALNTFTNIPQSAVTNLIADFLAKQNTLVSGVNIRTINGNTLLGSTDLILSTNDNTKLAIANNLSDLNNASAARTNLGLGSLAVLSSVNLSTQAAGILQAAQFPALTGDVTNTAGTVAMTIGTNKVINSMLAGGIDLTTKVTGLLPPSSGSTNNAALSFAAGVVYYGDGLKINSLSPGTPGFILKSNGTAAPSWIKPASDYETINLSTTSSAPITVVTYTNTNPISINYEVTVTAVKDDGTAGFSGKKTRSFFFNGTTLFSGSLITERSNEYMGSGISDATFTITNSGSDIVVQAIGENLNNISWTFSIKKVFTEVFL